MNFSFSKNDTNIEDKEDLLNGETSEINVDDSEEKSSSVKTHSVPDDQISDEILTFSTDRQEYLNLIIQSFKYNTETHKLEKTIKLINSNQTAKSRFGEIKHGPFVIFNILTQMK